MSLRKHRMVLALLWSLSFSLAIFGLLYLRWVVRIGPTASADFFEIIVDQYAPYLGAILGFQFAARTTATRKTEQPTVAYWLALGMSALWNIVLVGFVVQACLDSGTTQSAMKDVKLIIPKLAWIVAPAIGFLFGKPRDS
jgi:hypothetical protein